MTINDYRLNSIICNLQKWIKLILKCNYFVITLLNEG